MADDLTNVSYVTLALIGDGGASPQDLVDMNRRGGQIYYAVAASRLYAEPKRLEHGFTGVRPEYRRRGIATALGDAQLAWAAERGFEELTTTTGATNAALRAQKAKLGYEERPGPILVRGPV